MDLPCWGSKGRVEKSASVDAENNTVEEIRAREIPDVLDSENKPYNMSSDALLLTDRTVVVRTDDGRVLWIGSDNSLTATYKQAGYRAEMVLLSDDTVVTSNRYGELIWVNRGKESHSVSLGKVVAMLALPDDRVVVTTEDQIYWIKDGVRLARMDVPDSEIPNAHGVAVLADDTLVLVTHDRKRTRYAAHWIKDRAVTAKYNKDGLGYKMAVLPDGRGCDQWYERHALVQRWRVNEKI